MNGTVAAYEAAAARAYAEGRREQRCPNCGREEAGGSHCSAGPLSKPPCHFRPVHPDEWVAATLSDAQRAARTGGRVAPVHAEPRKAPRPPASPPRPLLRATAPPDGLWP